MNYQLDTILPKAYEQLSFINTNDKRERNLSDVFPVGLRNYNELGHSSLNLRTLEMLLSNVDDFDYDDYDAGQSYSIDDIVSDGQTKPTYYKSLQNGNLGNSLTDAAFWELKPLFAEELKKFADRTIANVISDVMSKKKELNQTKTLLKTRTLFDADRRKLNTIVNQNRTVGITIKLSNYNNIVFVLQKIGLWLTQSQNVPIKIYETSQLEAPIAEFDINGAPSFTWNAQNQRLGYIGDWNTGGEFKIVYDQADLTGQAYNYPLNYDYYAKNNCTKCERKMSNRVKSLYQYIDYIQPFYVEEANVPVDGSLWLYEDEVKTSDQSYGFNFSYALECDMTDIISENMHLFTDALISGMRVSVGKLAVESHRTNDSSELSRAANAVLSDPEGGGLMAKHEQNISDVDLDLSDLESPCMPKKPQTGIISSGV